MCHILRMHIYIYGAVMGIILKCVHVYIGCSRDEIPNGCSAGGSTRGLEIMV